MNHLARMHGQMLKARDKAKKNETILTAIAAGVVAGLLTWLILTSHG